MLALLVGVGLAELVSFLALTFLIGTDAISILRGHQKRLSLGVPEKDESHETIHPYTGWSFNPQLKSEHVIGGRSFPVNRLGLIDDGPTIVPPSDNRIVIGIAGGSVAWQFSVQGEQKLRDDLKADPAFRGKEIDIVRLALPGQKQPQQLMTLAWVQSLGAEFDIVVNIDGYNEAVLAIHDNYDAGVNIAYPKAWHARTLDIVEAREFSDSYELLRIRGTRQKLARNAVDSAIWWSPTYQLVWKLRDESLDADRVRLSLKLVEDHDEENGRSYVSAGPSELFASDADADKAATALWLRSSVQLHRLVTAGGGIYIHALQPNQYLPGSKPLSEVEEESFYSEDLLEGKTVGRIYPLMIEAGSRLRAEGVDFYDLTDIFQEIPETLYVDWCCHFNARGNEILAQHVAAAILDALPE